MRRQAQVALACLLPLLLGTCQSPSLPFNPTKSVVTVQVIHNPPAFFLPSPHPVAERAFRLAAHTLFLDLPMAQLASGADFDTIVQVFPWRSIQPRPDYYDWQATDDMVSVAHQYQLDLVVRLDMPPQWARRTNVSDLPFDQEAYLDFIGAVATRYQGYILGYIVWNEPNLAEEWGGWVAEPSQYADLLCAAYARIRQADPDAQVVAAGLAPTNEFSARAMDDREFLRQMLSPRVSRCFDVLAAHDYGYGLPPDDPHGNHAGLNLARLVDLHDIMVEVGASQPIWITELGYTIQPGLHPHVSPNDQANYLRGAFERVCREWPWVTMFTVWNLSYTGDAEMQGFSIIEADQSPRPALQVFPNLDCRFSP